MECHRYRKELIDRARPMVGDYAEDVVSDLMEYFLVGRFNAPDNPLPLLMWYVKRRCIDHIRQTRRMQQLPQDLQDEIEASESDPRIEQVEAAMRELPPMVSRLIILSRVENVSRAKIAEMTGIPKHRIRYLIEQGEAQIKMR
jgi:RNA polymerase sigma factor (sigma-70 family)